MREPERSGNSGRAQDTFKRIPASRPENDVRSPSPDDFTFLDAQERRKQGLPISRNQSTLQNTRRPIQASHSNGDTYRPPHSTSERSISPPPLRSSPMRRRRLSSSWAPNASCRDNHYSPSRGGPPFKSRQRGSTSAHRMRDYRDDSFELHPGHDWDAREPYPPRPERMERQPESPAQQKPLDSRPCQPPPAGSSLSARQIDTRSPHDEKSRPLPSKRPHTQLFRNISLIIPHSPPAQPVKSLRSETVQAAGNDLSPEIDKAEVNGIKNVPTGPASKSCNPPIPKSILLLPHLFIPSKSIPPKPTTTPHLAKLVQRHGPVHVVFDDTGYFIAFTNSVEGRSKLSQCEKAHNDRLFFGMYRIAMKPYPWGQPQGQSTKDCQLSAEQATAATSPLETAERHKPLENTLVVDGSSGHRRVHDEGAPELETPPKVLGEHGNLVGTNYRPQRSRPIPTNFDPNPLQAPRRLPPSTARPMSPLDSMSSISGRTGSDLSGIGSRRCHVCKTRSELDNLVKCTTCSRRYHRYCHTRRSITVIPGEEWQCQRCERKNVPLRDPQPAYAGQSVNDEEAWPANKKATDPNITLDGSLDHGQTAFFPAEQTEDTDRIENQTRPPSPVLSASVDIVAAHQMTSTVISMAPQPDKAQAQAEPPHSEDAHLTEAQYLVEKSFSITASSGPADQPNGVRNPGKLQLTKRKRIGLDERVKLPNSDASIFDLHEGEEQSSTKTLRPTTHLAPAGEPAEEPEALPQRRPPKSHTNTHELEPKTADIRRPVASASTANSVSRVTKRMKGPTPRMTPCVQCGAQTTKGLSGPATCIQCKKKAAAKLAEEIASQYQEQPSLQASRQGTPGAFSSSVGNALAQPCVGQDLPSRFLEGPVNDTQTVEATDRQPENGASHVSSHDVEMTNTVEHDNGDVELDQDVDMLDELDEAVASEQEDEAVLPGVSEASWLPSTPGQENGIKRNTQQTAAADQSDLGNSFKRPKGAYIRLAGMALYAADGNRLQTNRIVGWISKNIPGYDQSQGNWVNGVKATLRLNATGRSGNVICRQVELADGDDAEAGKYWWVLKPDVKDTIDRWDHSLQRPVPGPNAEPISDVSSSESNSDDDDEEIQRRTRLLEPPSSSRSKKLKSAKPVSRTSSKERPCGVLDAVLPDEAGNDADGKLQDPDSSDEEPLASQAKKAASSRSSDNQQRRTSFRSENYGSPSKAASRTDSTSLATLLAAPGVHPVRDDLGVRMLIQEETENIDFLAKDLRHWSEYYSANRFNEDGKLAEIKARPSRKQLFGKPAGALTFRSMPASASRFTLQSAADFVSIGKEPEEMEYPCDSLADFLGVREDVTFVPCIHKGFLAYKNPEVRNPNPTDIRLHK